MPSPYIQANTGGRLHPATEPSVAPLNRSFLYGDSIYEVWRTYHGVLFAWEEHLARLRRSAAALHLELPWRDADFLTEIRRTVRAYHEREPAVVDCYVRLQVSRGDGAIGLDPQLADAPGFVVLVQACPGLPAQQAATGYRLSVARSLRRNPALCLNPAWKTGNYLNNLLCLREARQRGADEVVILNLAGEITETSVTNLAFVQGNTWLTPPLSSGILEGVTRGLVLADLARRAGLAGREQAIHPEDLPQFDECMLLSTTRDVAPVAAIDGHGFRAGPGSVTLRLKDVFAAYTRDYAAAHPELRVLELPGGAQ